MDIEKLEKQAALGAHAMAGGLLAVWALFVYATRPVSSGGIDGVTHLALAAASFAPFALLTAAHVWFGNQLKAGADSIRG